VPYPGNRESVRPADAGKGVRCRLSVDIRRRLWTQGKVGPQMASMESSDGPAVSGPIKYPLTATSALRRSS
jgi:hypothetical protein